MKIYRIFTIALVLFFAGCSNAQTKKGTSFVQNIEPAEFQISSENHTVIDVRTPQEVAQGKIKNALNVNFYDADFEEQVSKLGLDKNKEVYLYCRSGGRSGSAATKLSGFGFTKVYNLTGGMMGWQSNKFEVVK